MASRTPEQTDALYRVRAEVRLLIGKYERRLKARAEDIALGMLLEDPNRDPEEVGRAAFARAGQDTGLIDGGATAPALAGPE